ncbi:hypothetical protein ACFV4K_25830 [Nocardia sp. NPDC059764]|uniref:CdiA C-terminal domain-containing protein n=1 Tax=Nocardia sp. NPDC059764 TaxID=3346939 RepID=UPI003656967F
MAITFTGAPEPPSWVRTRAAAWNRLIDSMPTGQNTSADTVTPPRVFNYSVKSPEDAVAKFSRIRNTDDLKLTSSTVPVKASPIGDPVTTTPPAAPPVTTQPSAPNSPTVAAQPGPVPAPPAESNPEAAERAAAQAKKENQANQTQPGVTVPNPAGSNGPSAGSTAPTGGNSNAGSQPTATMPWNGSPPLADPVIPGVTVAPPNSPKNGGYPDKGGKEQRYPWLPRALETVSNGDPWAPPDTTGKKEGDDWWDVLPNGQLRHNIIPHGNGNQSVDQEIYGPDGVTRSRVVWNGIGGYQRWTLNANGSHFYEGKDTPDGLVYQQLFDPGVSPAGLPSQIVFRMSDHNRIVTPSYDASGNRVGTDIAIPNSYGLYNNQHIDNFGNETYSTTKPGKNGGVVSEFAGQWDSLGNGWALNASGKPGRRYLDGNGKEVIDYSDPLTGRREVEFDGGVNVFDKDSNWIGGKAFKNGVLDWSWTRDGQLDIRLERDGQGNLKKTFHDAAHGTSGTIEVLPTGTGIRVKYVGGPTVDISTSGDITRFVLPADTRSLGEKISATTWNIGTGIAGKIGELAKSIGQSSGANRNINQLGNLLGYNPNLPTQQIQFGGKGIVLDPITGIALGMAVGLGKGLFDVNVADFKTAVATGQAAYDFAAGKIGFGDAVVQVWQRAGFESINSRSKLLLNTDLEGASEHPAKTFGEALFGGFLLFAPTKGLGKGGGAGTRGVETAARTATREAATTAAKDAAIRTASAIQAVQTSAAATASRVQAAMTRSANAVTKAASRSADATSLGRSGSVDASAVTRIPQTGNHPLGAQGVKPADIQSTATIEGTTPYRFQEWKQQFNKWWNEPIGQSGKWLPQLKFPRLVVTTDGMIVVVGRQEGDLAPAKATVYRSVENSSGPHGANGNRADLGGKKPPDPPQGPVSSAGHGSTDRPSGGTSRPSIDADEAKAGPSNGGGGNGGHDTSGGDPDRTVSSLDPDPDRKARGEPEVDPRGSTEKKRNLRIQEESAHVLAQHGYDILQNPGPVITSTGRVKNPDYLIEGDYFDCLAPSSSNIDQVRKGISKKVSGEQARRIVLNLDQTRVGPADVAAILYRKPVADLKEVLAVKDGRIIQLYP